MKMIKNATTALVSIAAVIAMTACSSDSDTPFVSGKLATGGFIKTVEEAGGSSFGGMFGISDSRYQLLYTPTDLEGSGNIESIGFQLFQNEATGVNCPNVTIKIGHTSLATLTTTYDSNVETGQGSRVTATSDLSLTIPSGLAGDYFSIPLDEPFNYNGVDNLVVEIVRNVACDASVLVNGSIAAYNASLYHGSDYNATTGTTSTTQMHMRAVFAGGVDTVTPLDNTGDNGNSIAPGVTGRTQALLRAEDINGSGPITGIAFEADTVTAATEMNITITMMNTSLTALDGNFTVNIDGSSTPVIVTDNLQVTIPAGVKYFWIPMTSTFDYDGSSNLLLDITSNVVSGGFATDYKNVPIVRIVSTTDVNAGTGTVRTRAYQPKLRFNGAPMDVITAGDAGGWYTLPFNGGSGYRTQYLYGGHSFGTSGAVTEVSFRLQNDSVASDYPAATIVLGHTANTTMTTDMPANMDDSTSVFSGTLSIPAGLKAGDWVTFPVSGFTYDSTKNLVVEVSQDAGDLTNVLRGTQTDVPGASGYAAAYKGSDTGFGTGLGQVDVGVTVSK